jgi:putative copper export protein
MTFPPGSEIGVILTRWSIFTSTVGLLGVSGLASFVLPRDRPETSRITRRLKTAALLFCFLLLLASTADILWRCCCIMGGMAATCPMICPMLLKTHMGHVWMLRVGLGALFLLTLMRDWEWLKTGRLAFAMLLGVCLSWSSHAADQGNFSVHLLIDSLHVLAAGLWIGGLFSLTLALWVESATMSAGYLAASVPRFSTLAGTCIVLLMGSGVYNTWVSLPSIHSFVTTHYGRVLLLKLCVFCVLACCGAVSRYYVVPRLRRHDAGASALFGRWVRYEICLSLIVLGITAVLSETMPPKSMEHNHAATLVNR